MFCHVTASAQSISQYRSTKSALEEMKWDFENALNGWTAAGSAFDSQPVVGATIKTENIPNLVTVGGDYWRNLPFLLGHEGNYLIYTADEPTGSLTSNDFQLHSTHKYFSFLIGGTSDLAHERLELQVRFNTSEDANELERQIKIWLATMELKSRSEIFTRSGNYITAVAATGEQTAGKSLTDLLRQEVIEIPAFLFGRIARLRIVDDSSYGHVNVDSIRFTETRPGPYRPPVWGYGDYHTHPHSHLAFGGLKGSSLLFGLPGGANASYSDPNLITKDIPHCKKDHGRGPMTEFFVNQAEMRFDINLFFKHPRSGGPEFHDFPSFLSGAHQQMHITQIRRNYEGGLRLMVAIATHNRGAEYLTAKVESDGTVAPPTNDREVVEAEIAEMRRVASLNHEWMEIANNPDDARRIIRQNKLAVILGIEVDQLGQLDMSNPSTPEAEVEYLWKLGIRAVIPIHASDNRLGGAAVFLDIYNWLNDFLNRGRYNLSPSELPAVPAHFFQVREGGCSGPFLEQRGECVTFRLPSDQRRLVIKKVPFLLWRRAPFPEPFDAPMYNNYSGHKNRKGLTDYGSSYIEELMNRGMIVDTAHMSDLSVEGVYDVIGRRLATNLSECSGFSLNADYSKIKQTCFEHAYPTIVSHVHFRAQSFYGQPTFVKNSLPSEYQISNRNIEMVSRVGGVLGPFVAERPLSLPPNQPEAPFKNDCSLSSKGFGFSFKFGLQKMAGRGVGMATDFTFIPGVSPRFGKDACWGFNLAGTEKTKERKLNAALYDIDAQRGGIIYEAMPPKPHVSYGKNYPLIPYQMGKRRPFDFNVDGLAHFGMVPDMLQDLKNLGMSTAEFESLFSSAEFYIRMWEKAWRVARCEMPSSRC